MFTFQSKHILQADSFHCNKIIVECMDTDFILMYVYILRYADCRSGSPCGSCFIFGEIVLMDWIKCQMLPEKDQCFDPLVFWAALAGATTNTIQFKHTLLHHCPQRSAALCK